MSTLVINGISSLLNNRVMQKNCIDFIFLFFLLACIITAKKVLSVPTIMFVNKIGYVITCDICFFFVKYNIGQINKQNKFILIGHGESICILKQFDRIQIE